MLSVKIKRLFFPIPTVDNTKDYWENRYQGGETSGEGSYGEFAIHKAEVINDFALRHDVKSAIEFGCGDGNQLSLFNFEHYTGFEISQAAVDICKNTYKNDSSKSFFNNLEYNNQTADLTMSLDVIYCILEETVYQEYMTRLFNSSTKYVLVFSYGKEVNIAGANHLKYWDFEKWIAQNRPDFKLIEFKENRLNKGKNKIASDFYFYAKQ